MKEWPSFDKLGIKELGQQTNIDKANALVLSGQFPGTVNIYPQPNEKHRLPLQKPRRPEHFTGRETELASLLKDLRPGRVITICGPGGIGKTALAAEAIWQLSPGNEPSVRFPDGIIFHTFYHKPQAALALENIAQAYGEDPRSNPFEAAERALAGRQALVILDGTEACNDLETVLSITGSCGVLITTRRHSDASSDFNDLLPLPLDKAVQLLQAWAGAMASDNMICQNICILLGRLPLAVYLVGRYMAHRRQFASDYLAWLEKTPLAALDLGKKQHQSIPLLIDHSLIEVSSNVCSVLSVAGALALKPFESQLIAIALDISSIEADHCLGQLVDCGILDRPDASYVITHSLVQTYAREKMPLGRDPLVRLSKHFDATARKLRDGGLQGFIQLDAQRSHVFAIQSLCFAAKEWYYVRKLTWALINYLDIRGHWTELIAAIDIAIKAVRAEGERYDEMVFLRVLGRTHSNLGNAQKAIECHSQALAISREIKSKKGEESLLQNLASDYSALGDDHHAIEYIDDALKIARELKDKLEEGMCLTYLGIFSENLGEVRKAIEYYQQALPVFPNTNNPNEGWVLCCLGSAHRKLGEVLKAIEFHDKALAIVRKRGNRGMELANLGELGDDYLSLGEARKAIEYYEQALVIIRQIRYLRNEGIVLECLGKAYIDLGEIPRAMEYAKQALAIACNTRNTRNEVSALCTLSKVYIALDEIPKAIECNEKALAISREIRNLRLENYALCSLGKACIDLGEIFKSVKYNEEVLAISREIGDIEQEISALCSLSEACIALGEIPKAIEYNEEALVISRRTGDRRGEGNALWKMGLSLDKLGQRPEAIESTRSALKIFEQIESPYAEGVRQKLAEWQGEPK